MAQIPVVQNLYDEFVLYVVMIDTEQTMDEICAQATKTYIGFDKNQRAGQSLSVRRSGEQEALAGALTVAQAGIAPMASLEFYYDNETEQ